MLANWGISKNHFFGVYAIVFLSLISSKGLSLIPGYAIDDWYLTTNHLDLGFFIERGRFTQAGFELLFNFLDVTSVSVSFPSLIFTFVIAPLAITVSLFYLTANKSPIWALMLAGAFIGAHPYITEYFSFRQSSFGLALMFSLMACIFGLFFQITSEKNSRAKKIETILVFLLIFILSGTQQTSLLVIGMILLGRFLIEISTNSGKISISTSLRLNRNQILVFAAASLSYLVVHLVVTKLGLSVTDPRTQFISFGDLGPRILQVKELIKTLILLDEPVVPSLLKWTTIVLVLIMSFGALLRTKLPTLLIICFGVVGVLLSITLISISGVWWPAPRTLFAYSFAIATLIALLGRWVVGLWKHLSISIGTILVVMLAFESSTILNDQLRINRWDIWASGAIASQVEQESDGEVNEIVLVNPAWGHAGLTSTSQDDLNISALFVDYASASVFTEATGMIWKVSALRDPNLCTSVPIWPKNGSIYFQDNTAYVCMGAKP